MIDWIPSSLRPLSIVTDLGLLRLLGAFLQAPQQNELRCFNSASPRSLQAHSALKCAEGVAVTFDLWSSSMNVSFATYTGHYIDADVWKLRAVILGTPSFPEQHAHRSQRREVR